MPIYQFPTDFGTVELEHDGDPKDLLTVVNKWVEKQRSAASSSAPESSSAKDAPQAVPSLSAGDATAQITPAGGSLNPVIEAAPAESNPGTQLEVPPDFHLEQPTVEEGTEPGILERAGCALAPILGPTKAQQIKQAVPVTKPDGSIAYEYKPAANEIEKRGLIPALTEAGSALVDLPTAVNLWQQGKGSTLTDIEQERQRQMLPADGKDSALVAIAKAAHNATLNFAHTIANPALLAVPGSRALSAGFAVDMAHGAYQQLEAATQATTLQAKIEGYLGAFLSAAFAYKSAQHGIEGAKVPTVKPKDVLASIPDEQFNAMAASRDVRAAITHPEDRTLFAAEIARRNEIRSKATPVGATTPAEPLPPATPPTQNESAAGDAPLAQDSTNTGASALFEQAKREAANLRAEADLAEPIMPATAEALRANADAIEADASQQISTPSTRGSESSNTPPSAQSEGGAPAQLTPEIDALQTRIAALESKLSADAEKPAATPAPKVEAPPARAPAEGADVTGAVKAGDVAGSGVTEPLSAFDKSLQDERRAYRKDVQGRPIEQQPPRMWYELEAAKKGIGPQELTGDEVRAYKQMWQNAVDAAVRLNKPVIVGGKYFEKPPKQGWTVKGDLWIPPEGKSPITRVRPDPMLSKPTEPSSPLSAGTGPASLAGDTPVGRPQAEAGGQDVRGAAEPSGGAAPGADVIAEKPKRIFRRKIPEAPGGSDAITRLIDDIGKLKHPETARQEALHREGKTIGATTGRGGEYDPFTDLPAPLRSLIFREVLRKQGETRGGLSPDEAAQAAYEHGLIRDPSPDTLAQALKDAWQTRLSHEKANKASEKEMKAAETKAAAQTTAFEKESQEPQPGAEKLSASDLNVGDVVEVNGETMKVTEVDPEENVTLEDGSRYGVQEVKDGDFIYGEMISKVGVDTLADWPTLDTPEKTDGYIDHHQLAEQGSTEAVPFVSPPPAVERAGQADTSRTEGAAGVAGGEVAALPKLRRGEVQGDLLSTQTEDLTLVGETGVDTVKRAEEAAQREKDAAEAKALQDKQQLDIFAEPSPSKEAVTPIQEPPTPRKPKFIDRTEEQKVQMMTDAYTRIYEMKARVEARENSLSADEFEQSAMDSVDSAIRNGREINWSNIEKWAGSRIAREAARRGEGLDQPLGKDTETTGKDMLKSPEAGPVENAQASDVQAAIDEAMAKLPEGERRIMEETANGKSNEEIAELLGMTEGSVRTMKSKARKTLAEKLIGKLDRAIDATRPKPGEFYFDPFFIQSVGKPALRAALQVMKAAIEAGKPALDAIEDGIASLAANAAKWNRDLEAKAREYFTPVEQVDKPSLPKPPIRLPKEPATPRTESATPPAPAPAPAGSPESSKSASLPKGGPEGPVIQLRMAFTDAEREQMGIPPWIDPNRITNRAAWEQALSILSSNPDAARPLIAETLLHPRALEPHEKAIILHEQVKRNREFVAAVDARNAATTAGEMLSADVRMAAARDANQEIFDVDRAMGRASGQSLQAQKMGFDTETQDLARMESIIQSILKPGDKLGNHPKLVEEIAELHRKLSEERAKTAAAEAAAKEADVASIMARVLADIREAKKSKGAGETIVDFGKRMEDAARQRLRARSGGRLFSGLDPLDLLDHAQIGASWIIQGIGNLAKFTEKLVATYGEAARPYAGEIFEASRQQAEIFQTTHQSARKNRGEATTKEIVGGMKSEGELSQSDIYQLVRARIAENPSVDLSKAKIGEIMADVAEELQPVRPGITEGDVRDLFSGYGKEHPPLSREQINVKMRELHSASGVVSKLERAIAGEEVKKIGPQRDRPTPLVRELTKELVRTMRENGLETRTAEGMLKTAHDARVTRLKNSIEDTQRQIEQRQRTPKTPEVPWTPEELALKDQLNEMKSRLDDLLNEPDSDELSRVMDQIESVTDKLATGNIDPKAKSQNVPTQKLAEAREKLTALNKQLSDRRKAKRLADNPPDTEEEKQLASLAKQEETLAERIRTGSLDPATGKPTADTQAVAAARDRVAIVRKQLSELQKAKRESDPSIQIESLTKSIAELDRKLREGEIDPKAGTTRIDTPEIEQLRSERDTMQRLLSELRAKPRKTPEQRTLESLERRNRDARALLTSGNPFRAPGKPPIVTPEITGARMELQITNRLLAAARKASTEGVKRDLDRYRKMIARKSSDLRDKIARGDVSTPPRRELSAEKTRAAAPYKLLQEEWAQLKRREELKNQNRLQKTLRWSTYLAHEMLLLGSSVFQKLATAAATTSSVVSPLEEVAGFALGKAFPFIAEKADVEVASSFKSLVRGEARAAAQGMLRAIDDIGSTLKHGKADFEIEFGKHYDTEMVSWVGRLHGALKTVPARQAFERTFERLSEKYAERGLDPTDPDVRITIGTQALIKALESKFQDPNMAVGAFKAALRYVEQKDANVGAVTKAVARTEMPVMTVASNITWRVFESVYGVPVASARIAGRALTNLLHNYFGKRGADFVLRSMNDMSREQVESIAKQFKRGAVGSAAFLLGAYLYQNLGGFYHAGEERQPGEVKEEEIRTPLGDIPKEFIHHPAFTVMQAGAATMQVAESRLRKSDRETQGVGAGLLSAGVSVAEESPFGGAVESVGHLFNPYTRMDAVGQFARTLLGISGPVAWLAKHNVPFTHLGGDEDQSGEVTRRKARTFGEELKLGIPGLRKEVPEAKKKRR